MTNGISANIKPILVSVGTLSTMVSVRTSDDPIDKECKNVDVNEKEYQGLNKKVHIRRRNPPKNQVTEGLTTSIVKKFP